MSLDEIERRLQRKNLHVLSDCEELGGPQRQINSVCCVEQFCAVADAAGRIRLFSCYERKEILIEKRDHRDQTGKMNASDSGNTDGGSGGNAEGGDQMGYEVG